MPIGLYFYHLGQKPKWGDSIKVGQLKVGAPAVLFECEADFDEGYIRGRVDGGEWVRHNLVVTDKTAVTWAWLDAYYGGPAVAPENMAWDISDYKLENLGPDPLDPSIDWDAVARMIADKEEAAKETAESEAVEPLDPPPEARDETTVLAAELRVLAEAVDAFTLKMTQNQLRNLAEKIESL
jgi:hypothetical protein